MSWGLTVTSGAPAAPRAIPEGPLGRPLLWLLLAMAIISLPRYPTLELDSSWRMALGWFFHQGLQIGRDVVFTYGPLGYVMGRTYFGLQFASLVLWQVFTGGVFAAVIIASARVPRPVDEISTLAHKLRDLYEPDALFLLVEMRDYIQMVARSSSAM